LQELYHLSDSYLGLKCPLFQMCFFNCFLDWWVYKKCVIPISWNL